MNARIEPGPRQDGVALLVVLVILLMVTGLGLASIRTLTLQERMTANTLDRALALQSASNVTAFVANTILKLQPSSSNSSFKPLATGSADCATINDSDDSSRCTASGLCLTPGPKCMPRWKDSTFSSWQTVKSTYASSIGSASNNDDSQLATGLQQQYFVELLGSGFKCVVNTANSCNLYRVTVRTNTGTERSVVQLQSNIMVESLGSPPVWTPYALSRHEIVN